MIISSAVFKGIDASSLEEFVQIGALRTKTFHRGEFIFHSGDKTEEIGIVQSGSILIENIDPWGNRSILSSAGTGQVFAESYALSSEPLMVDVAASEDSIIVFLNIKKLIDESNAGRSWYGTIMKNLLSITSRKNMMLSMRIFCTTPKTIRLKLLMYLTGLYLKSGSRTFVVPFDRQQMADYLNVERTALSKELGHMKRDGLLEWKKNRFTLLTDIEHE